MELRWKSRKLAASTMKIYEEKINEKYSGLKKDFVEVANDEAEMRKENANKKISQKNGQIKRQTLSGKKAKMQGISRVLKWEMGVPMKNEDILPKESTDFIYNKLASNSPLMDHDYYIQRLDMAIEQQQLMAVPIKQECKNVEIAGNYQFGRQIQSTSTINGEQIGIVKMRHAIELKAFSKIKLDGEERSSPKRSNLNNNDDDVEFKYLPAKKGRKRKERTIPIDTPRVMFGCRECDLTFNGPDKLKAHLRIHTADGEVENEVEKTFDCPECGKSFKKSRLLKQHRNIHCEERPFKCAECGKAFKKMNTLKEHERIHSGEKPFKCKECDEAFRTKKILNEHWITHVAGEKPFVCAKCGKAFRLSRTLKAHENSHSDMRPFACPECGKPFKRSRDMKVHRKRKH